MIDQMIASICCVSSAPPPKFHVFLHLFLLPLPCRQGRTALSPSPRKSRTTCAPPRSTRHKTYTTPGRRGRVRAYRAARRTEVRVRRIVQRAHDARLPDLSTAGIIRLDSGGRGAVKQGNCCSSLFIAREEDMSMLLLLLSRI